MDDSEYDWRLQSDWYSPTRLHDSPVKYDFSGDRFIPNRSLMDIDQAHSELANRTSRNNSKPNSIIGYREKLESLKLDNEGRLFQMLVFRGSPKSSGKMKCMIEEIRRSDEELSSFKQPVRRFPANEISYIDARHIINDYHLNVMDWGKTNILAIALGDKSYLWNATNYEVNVLSRETYGRRYPSCVAWSGDGKTIAVGYACPSGVKLYDAETLKPLRFLDGHFKRVGCIAWNGRILTSGSKDRTIINHDVRAKNSIVSLSKVHSGEICGLRWSITGNTLASGGDDDRLFILDARKMSSMQILYQLNHLASVKALAWCPYNHDVLASGGGLGDGFLKIWNIQNGTCVSSTGTFAQITGLQWNRHHKEILSGTGNAVDSNNSNKICLWKYPSMSKLVEYTGHTDRVLQLSQSPDGLTAVSAAADETLRFWDVFGPATDTSSSSSYLDSLLSFKTLQIR